MLQAYKMWNKDIAKLPTGWIHHILLVKKGRKWVTLFYVPQLTAVRIPLTTFDSLTMFQLPMHPEVTASRLLANKHLADKLGTQYSNKLVSTILEELEELSTEPLSYSTEVSVSP